MNTLIIKLLRMFFGVVLFLILMPNIVTAQDLRVADLPWWNPGYLTVVDCGTIVMLKDADADKYKSMDRNIIETVRNNFDGFSDFDGMVLPFNVGLMWTLVSVDNKDAKGLSPSDFYGIIDDPKQHTFLFEKPTGEKTALNQILRYVPAFVKALEIDYSEEPYREFNLGEINKNAFGINVLVDWSVDWSKYKTYDFAITSNDPLTDKEILNSFAANLEGYMKRDESNPDVLITIARDAKSSISYSYVPPKTTYVKTGSTTKKVYSWLGINSYYQTQDNLQAIQQDGYVKELSSSDIFLEITMLDTKKIDSKTPPVIYKATCQKSYPEKIDLIEEQCYYASTFDHPAAMKISVGKLHFNNTLPMALRWGWAQEDDAVKYIYRINRFLEKGDAPQTGDEILSVKKKSIRPYFENKNGRDEVTIKYKRSSDGKKKSCKLNYFVRMCERGENSKDWALNDWSLDFYPYRMYLSR